MTPAASAALQQAMSGALAARQAGALDAAWPLLERAHVLSQPSARLHVKVHLAMLTWAVQRSDAREIVGQIFRILVAAPGSWTGRYPPGNTGGANVSAFAPMPIAPELAALMAEQR